MGMHWDLRIRTVLQATISSSEFLNIPTTTKFTKALKYIHDENSWERCYVLIKILHPCLRVFLLADSNLAGMDKVYYYSRITKQCIEKTKLDLDYQRGFPEVSSFASIWITSDDKSDEDEPTVPTSKDSMLYSENICYFISNLWNKGEEHINTDYAVTDWMSCVIPHSREDVF